MIRYALILALLASPALAQAQSIVPDTSEQDSQSPLTAWSIGLDPQMKAKTAHTDVAPMLTCDAVNGKKPSAGEDVVIVKQASQCQPAKEAEAPKAPETKTTPKITK